MLVIKDSIVQDFKVMKSWRQHLHQYPELDFKCHNTADFVVEKLRQFGVDSIHTGIAQSGVVAVIKGKTAGGCIGLRADMDALPITEVNNFTYKSKIDGVMHACGHDGHTTMLLGAAKYLAMTRNFSGRCVLIFQPAEEGGGGGRAMCREDIMVRFGIDEVYALHNWPGLAVGQFALRSGAIMAAADTFSITVRGYGGHAAMPSACVDPIQVGCTLVQVLQSIISRNVSAADSAVLSITRFNGGRADNIIPNQVYLGGTIRSFKTEVKALIVKRMKIIIKNLSAVYGAHVEFKYVDGYPATCNSADKAQFAGDVAVLLVGESSVNRTVERSMGAEDFSYMLQERPGAYVFIGQGNSAGLHHPSYDYNDEISPLGACFFVKLVETAQPVLS